MPLLFILGLCISGAAALFAKAPLLHRIEKLNRKPKRNETKRKKSENRKKSQGKKVKSTFASHLLSFSVFLFYIRAVLFQFFISFSIHLNGACAVYVSFFLVLLCSFYFFFSFLPFRFIGLHFTTTSSVLKIIEYYATKKKNVNPKNTTNIPIKSFIAYPIHSCIFMRIIYIVFWFE